MHEVGISSWKYEEVEKFEVAKLFSTWQFQVPVLYDGR